MAFATAAAALYLTVCFALAAVAKLRDFTMFAATVAEIVPRVPARGAAGFVVVAESVVALAIGVGLVMSSNTSIAAGATLAIASAVLFAGAIGMVLRRGDAVACKCFGGDETIRAASLIGPALITIAGLIVMSGGAWPSSLPAWIASGAAGVYLLIAQRLLPLIPVSKNTRRSR